MKSRWKGPVVLAALMSLAAATQARADSILFATMTGNDCSGVLGQGFFNCAIPSTFDLNTSPVIIQFNADGTVNEINSALFPTISGNEFSFTFNSASTGSWTYTPGAGDPATLVSFFVAKGGDGFNLFSVNGNGPNSWFTPLNNNGGPSGLSHLTFFGGGSEAVVPEPTTWLLVGSGLMFARRFRKNRKSA
jgi:hypothetical protein